jgi:hypothetical protein
VNGGVLVLTPPTVCTSVVAVLSGSVPNATFEAEQLTSYRRNIANGETYYGWKASFPAPTGGADNAVFVFNRSADTTKWPCDYEAPEGKQVLALKQDASVSTTLSLSAAGIYDVSFFTSARSILTGRHEFDLSLVDGQTTNRVATVQTVNRAYVRQTFRLPWLAAGDHSLLLKRTVLGVDTLGTIDDVKVTLVTERIHHLESGVRLGLHSRHEQRGLGRHHDGGLVRVYVHAIHTLWFGDARPRQQRVRVDHTDAAGRFLQTSGRRL